MTDVAPNPAPPPPVPPNPAPNPGPAPAPAWHEGKVDAETLGFWQNKGYDLTDPGKLALSVTAQYRQAEKLIGVPADQLVRWPKDLSDPNWKAIHQRLGVPDKPEDYDFSTVKDGAGQPMAAKIGDLVRSTAASQRLTKDAAAAVAQAFVKHLDGEAAALNADRTAALKTADEALRGSWGKNYDANMFVARAAFLKVAGAAGMKEDAALAQAEAMFRPGGFANPTVLEMWRLIGSRMGEDRFVGGGAGSNAPMSREAAMAEITSLKNDPQFRKRYLEGGADEKKRMDALHAIAYPKAA